MAELVRPKKPKQRERQQEDVFPLSPSRPAIVNGVRLPDVPSHILSERREREMSRSPSPEPEEQELSDFDDSLRQDEVNEPPNEAPPVPMRQAPAPPLPRSPQERVAPPLPPRNMIFPRSTSMVAESSKERPSSETKRSVVQYPTVPELAELPSYSDALHHPQIYPSGAISRNVHLAHSQSVTALPEKTRFSMPPEITKISGEAPPLYPSICTYERNAHGLMTEADLISFYHNPLYEYADAFVDRFISAEEVPIAPGSLFPLLKRFKEVCDLMNISQVKGKANTESLQKTLNECWKQEKFTQDGKGKCGENRDGTGRGHFVSYMLQQDVLDQMNRLLSVNRSNLMDHSLCGETMFRSLALQIQWQIVLINNSFMSENGLGLQSPPSLIDTGPLTPSRVSLRSALSDLFYHLRYPRLTTRYTETICGWIKELVCILNMRQSCDDGVFVLCHLLRLPSPIDSWAAPFLQNFIQAQSSPKLKVDYCLALLTHLLNPIRARESFLRHVSQSEKEESTWEILAEDDGEANEFSFVTISESDLISLFGQLPISELYSLAYLAFTQYNTDKGSQFTSMIAFQLLIMKILDNGLTNYAKPGYKSFCKQIGIYLKQSVRELCNNWKLICGQLPAKDEQHLQKEVDRIVLLSLNYLIHRDSVGLFQFVVNLPYGLVSEECRNRCEYALRSNTKMPINELYETPICEIQARIRSQNIKQRIENLGPQDSEFLVNSLASIGSFSNTDVAQLIKELIDICFCDESTRNNLYKCGGEAIGQILSKRPDCLHQLLSIVDRNLQHMDTYAINVLSSSRLFDCRLSESMISIIGKWLINNPPDHGGNRLARRVLSSLHWGPSSDGQTLWIDAEVHTLAADTVVKAHSVHCSRSNSMISKSLKQIAKLASKVGDAEALFQQFCWDLLVKLKLPKTELLTVQNDLTAYYVRIVQNYEESVPIYLEKAVPLLSDLVSSASSVACVVLLSRLIAQHYGNVNSLADDKRSFMATFERLLHIDQLSYAVQWISGPTAAPTPIVRLICSAISYYSSRVVDLKQYLRAWLQLLCLARVGWNDDPVTYQIVGTLVRIAFVHDPQGLNDLLDIIQQSYTQQLAAEKSASKGLFSVFSADTPPSPLIPDAMLSISPFASYLMLLVEQNSFAAFYGHMFDTLAKKDKYTLDIAVKKAASKSSSFLPISRLSVFRWAELATHCKDSPIFPIVLQKMIIEAYQLRKANNHKLCFARRLLDAPEVQVLMGKCRQAMEESTLETKGLSRAVIGWLFTKHEVTRTGFDFSIFDLDYLLQLVLAGDTNVWTDFVNIPEISAEEIIEQKLYSTTCQLTPKQRLSPSPPELGSPRNRTSAVPFPVLPIHIGLPVAPSVEPSVIFQQHVVMQIATPFIKTINSLAVKYTECGDKMIEDDNAYCELIKTLYHPTQQTIPIELRCGSACARPNAAVIQVSSNVFNSAADAQMSVNRNKRIEFWNELNTSLMDKAAVATASIEYLARMVANIASGLSSSHRNNVQMTGRSFFYLMTSSIGDNELLFAAASDAYNHSLAVLGHEFVKCRPEEQMDVMRLVLEGFVLSDPLVEAFTPEVLNSNDLFAVYSKLSEAVRMPQKSKMALQLLGRLGMQQAAAGLPPHQFAALLPIAYANLASQPDPSSALHVLCLQHVVFFVFHHFPSNITNGLELALDGCSSNSTPCSLLDAFVEKLGANDFLNKKTTFDLGAAKAEACAVIMAKKLDEARIRFPNFHSIYAKYMDPISRLSQLFLFVPIRDGYQPNQPATILQRDLYEHFQRIVSVFSPLIAPYSPTHPPFSVSHENTAVLVLDRFIELLNSLHYNSGLAPGMQNVQSLVWQYYCEKLSTLTHGTQHYYDVLERQLVRLNWQILWPSKLAISAMETCLEVRSPDCASFVSQVVVRIPWSTILQQMNDDHRPLYMSSLFGVLIRLVSKPNNYDKVRASLLELVKSLSLRTDWNMISQEEADRIAAVVATCLPSDSLSNPIEIVSVIQIIWRKICGFSPREPFSQVALHKQTSWLKTECSLLLKCDPLKAPAAYNSLISDVNSLAVNHSNLRAFCVVSREINVLWRNITNNKLGEALVSLWGEYLTTNPTSPLVLTSLNTLIDSLNSDQLTTALKVIEVTISAYFSRTDSNWAELMHWIQFPNGRSEAIKGYLMTVPTTANKVEALPLTLRTYLSYGNTDDKKFFELHNYVVSLKPKHVSSEPAFLCLLARLVQWMASRSATLPAHFSPTDDLLPPLVRWLNKSSKDESSFISNLISSKKTAHSSKLRVILQIFELYLIQQTLGDGKRPRCEANSPVLNSRITTLKELAQQKSSQSMSAAFNKATAYFVQVESHNIHSAAKLLLEIGKSTFGDRFLSDV